MSVVRVYRDQLKVKALLLEQLQKISSAVISVQQEFCFYIQTATPVAQWNDLDQLESYLGGKVKFLLGDPWLNGGDLHRKPQLLAQGVNSVLVEIGPRLNFTTSWSTNAVSICHSAGITSIVRLEKAQRFLVKAKCQVTKKMRNKILSVLHDPMTEQEYSEPLCTFSIKRKPEPWSDVDVMSGGRLALKKTNDIMGLAFDDWDLDYYTGMFLNKMKRNPTTVELFDLAQSNSEHCRHWFFKGDYFVDGKKLPISLMDMVTATNKHESTNQNNVIAFSDNSSGMKGWSTTVLVAENPMQASRLVLKPMTRHLIFTAETHNFPTGVAPFSGATTGTGGRIRDVQAAGRGGHVVAGTAGYCFGNLHIPDYKLPWEFEADYPPNFASPLEVAIEASNGASDYGNKFGEPVLTGFARSFGLLVGEDDKERREWIKPIMFSGGMGTLDDDMVQKLKPNKGNLLMKIGGPVYRIGVGGGAASSVQVQGDNAAHRDLGAVQRGDAEMEQKMNRLLRGCLEMRPNPILSIHDQGAGGNANVLKELMEGSGGTIYSESFSVGDPTLSTLELWGAEYQESNAILTSQEQLPNLARLAARERCPIDTVGVITNDQKVLLVEDKFDLNTADKVKESNKKNPVDLKLDWVLGKMPKKEFHWTKSLPKTSPLKLPRDLTVRDALDRVLRLPSVASKRYLTNKVDRSVTGLVAQQQCVGPLDTPLADVAVTALSYFQKEGTATSIGEQPVKILVNPPAGARMSVLEALSNLAAAPITDIKDIKCSANWMWPAKLPGEGYALYEACEAMCEIMKTMGIAVDGGKDSLSMAARIPSSDGDSTVVKAPGSLVISAYAPCTDITKVVTPDLKGPGRGIKSGLIWVRPVPAYARLGGTALAQVYSQLGRDTPDVELHETVSFVAAFKIIQELIKDEQVLSLHDVSDGGLITCLFEMGMAGLGGFTVNIPPPPAPPSSCLDDLPLVISALFSEEVGWVMEVEVQKVQQVVLMFHNAGVPGTCPIGSSTHAGRLAQMKILVDGVDVVNYSVLEAASVWEETSFEIETLQMNRNCAEAEFRSFSERDHASYHVPFEYKDFTLGNEKRYITEVRVAIIREEGTNGDREMAAALIHTGFTVYDLNMSDLINGLVKLDDYRGIIFPGGFSYADVLGSGIGWAASILGREELKVQFESWKNQRGTFSLGVCNGCQLMSLLGWLNTKDDPGTVPSIRLVDNKSGRFESRWSRIMIESSKSILLKNMEKSRLGVWVAHGEGQFVYKDNKVLHKLEASACIAMRYLDDSNKPTEKYPYNPNGSIGGVAGVTSSCGRHLAIMPHPERCVLRWQMPYLADPLLSSPHKEKLASPWSKLFQNGLDYCLNNKG